MDEKQIAAMFKTLGDPTRLSIFNFLRSCCCPVALDPEGDVRPVHGPTVGEICCQVTGDYKITSTLSFHLKELRNAGLITMEKRGRNMICGIDSEALAVLGTYFSSSEAASKDCC